jgi:hypothetical protein
MKPVTCFFKDQLVYIKSDTLGRLFTVTSDSRDDGTTWCMCPMTGLVVALDTGNLELAPRCPERLLAEACDDERQASHAVGCWLLTTNVILVVAIIYYFSK